MARQQGRHLAAQGLPQHVILLLHGQRWRHGFQRQRQCGTAELVPQSSDDALFERQRQIGL